MAQKRPVPKKRPFKQSRADSLMEAYEGKLDSLGFSGGPKDDSLLIVRGKSDIKPPTEEELQKMRKRQAQRRRDTI